MRRTHAGGMSIAVLASAGMLSSLQFTLIVPVLPDIPTALDVGPDDASWLVTIALLTGTVVTPVFGRLADVYGRRRMLLVSLALLTAGSALAALWDVFPAVLVGRALQGTASAIVPIGISLIRETTNRARANMGAALMSGTIGIGSALGLPLSGVLATLGGLPLLFGFSAIAAALFVGLVVLVVPASAQRSPGRFDAVGTVLFAVALAAALVVVSKSLSWGQEAPWAIAALVAMSALATAAWIPWELHSASPAIDLRLSTRPRVLQINVASLLLSFGMYANHLLTMQEARAPVETGTGLGIPTLGAGLVLLPGAAVMIAVAPLGARLLTRLGPRTTLALGATVMCTAFVFRFFAHESTITVLLGTLFVGTGTALSFAAMPVLIMDAVPASAATSAVAVNALVRSVGGAVASAGLAALILAFGAAGHPDFISETGLRVALLGVAGLCAIGAITAIALPRDMDRRFDSIAFGRIEKEVP